MSMLSPKFIFIVSFFAAILITAFTACEHRGGNNPTPTGPTIDYKITIVSGNNQSGPIGTQLAAPLKVYVTDDAGVKQVAAVVRWSVVEGYGDLSATSVTTDVEGYAETYLTPVDYAGEVQVQAKVQYTDASVTFTATGQ